MTVVALTGGVAAGKSTVARVLRQLGATVIDADVLAREAVARGSAGLRAVVARFGPDILLPSGELDRGTLGAIIFSDPAARRDLNAIVHPEVKRLYAIAVAHHMTSEPETPLVYDVPLLAEARDRGEFSLVVVVHAPAELRVQRLRDYRHLSAEEALSRVNAQASDAERLTLADVVIDATRSVEDTESAAQQLYEEVVATWPDRLNQVARAFPRTSA